MNTTATDPFADLASAPSTATLPLPQDGPPPSDKQVKFYTDLLRRKGACDDAEVERRIQKRKDAGGWNKRSVSKAIDKLKAMPDAPPEKLAEVRVAVKLEDGVYKTTDGRIVVVYHTVHGANQQVAKELRAWKTGKTRKDGKDEWAHEFEYLGKAGLKDLTPERMLSQEEAKELGILYGFCVRCGKTLTRNESQYVGYGSTCAGRMGWWYPSKSELAALLKATEAKTTNTKDNRKDEGR